MIVEKLHGKARFSSANPIKSWYGLRASPPVWFCAYEIYGWFTEGFDTADLKDAKALLDELSG
jgi:hypothetical protein